MKQNREQILLSKQLVTVDRSVPMEVDWQRFAVQPPDRAALMPLLRELEFTGLIKEYLPEENAPVAQVVQTDTLPTVGDTVYFDVQNDRLSLWTGTGEVSSVPIGCDTGALLRRPDVRKVPYDLKSAIGSCVSTDSSCAALRRSSADGVSALSQSRQVRLEEVVFDIFGSTLAGDPTPWIQKVYEHMRPQVDEQVRDVYEQIELPLIPVLANMERTGIGIDPVVLRKMSGEMGTQIQDLTQRIFEEANCEFNLNSPRQLGEVLFEKLNLPHKQKLKKSGQYSTAVEVLEELAESYPAAAADSRVSAAGEVQVDVHRRDPGADRSGDVPSAHVVQSDGRCNGAPVEQQSQPAEHSGADGTGAQDSRGVRSRAGMVVRLGGLFAGGVAHRRAPFRRSGID